MYWDYEFDNGRLASWEASQGLVKPPGPRWLKAVAGKQGFAEVTYLQSGFDDTEFTNAEMVHASQLAGLQAILLHRTGITDSGIFHIRNLPRLRCFLFRGEGLTNSCIQHLNIMPQLSEVALTNSRIDDDGIEELCSNTKIWRLEIGGTKITDKGLGFLSRLENLTYLDLSDTSITDSGAKFLGELSGLEYLNLNGTEVGNSGIASLVSLKESLGHLCIAGTQVTDECNRDLRQLENLGILEVDQILLGRGRREREDARRLTTSQSLESLIELQELLPNCSINANSPGLRKGLPSTDDGAAVEMTNP